MLATDVESALIAAEAARRTAQFALIGSSIGVIGALIVAIITQLSAKRTQRELKGLELRNNESLAQLNASLGKSKSEDDARLEYDYEARKRLYKECEPVLFRLSEASENALHRIFSLARTARDGNLGPERPSWLAVPGYYLASTIYHLLVPAVIFRLLQDRLTLVDLTVDQRISEQYLITKWLYLSFTEDFTLAKTVPTLVYEPFIEDWEERREVFPATHWRQGLNLGRLDMAVESMFREVPQGPMRCMSFGEFEMAFYQDLAAGGSKFGNLADAFLGFHPAHRPVLWRILVVQAHLHAALMNTFAQLGATTFVTTVPTAFDGTDFEKLDWLSPQGEMDETNAKEPIQAAKEYLSSRLPLSLKPQNLAQGNKA